MQTGLRIQPAYGGPAITLQDDGYISVDGLGIIRRKWAPGVDQWRAMITMAAANWDIPESWIAGVMCQESAGIQGALSNVGAIGLMQIMPDTPRNQFGLNLTKQQIYDPATNIGIGARLLSKLANLQHWNIVAVAASYNAGGVYPFSGSAASCTHDGLWHVRENCGYCEQVVRGINTAIDNGYSGIGANESPSESILPNILLMLTGIVVMAGAMMFAGILKPPVFLRNVIPIPQRNPYTPTWRDFIRGEWWLLPDGSTEFADRDTGDVAGHAAQAQDAMLDRDVLVEGLIARGKMSEGAAEFLETASQVLNEHENDIDDELGASAALKPPIRRKVAFAGIPLWRSIKKEPEQTYMECWGAVRVAGRAFQADHITDKTIEAMQGFLLDQFAEAGGDIEPDKSSIEIEDLQGNYASVPIAEFLNIKHVRELWPVAA